MRQCLDGFVMQQTNFPFEAIVHDDASTDGSAAIIREYAQKYPDIIKPIYETENQYSKYDGSLGRIMDRAMSPSSKYIAICEGDDYWTDPLKLQKQVDVLEQNIDVTIVFCKVQTVNKEGIPLDWTIPSNESRIPERIITLDDYMKEEYYYARWTFHTSTFFFRRKCLGLHSELKTTVYKHFPYGDQPLLLSCLFQGTGYYLPEFTGCYRVDSGGYMSNLYSSYKNRISQYERLIKAWTDLDRYMQGRYTITINRRIDMAKFNILRIRYVNGEMNQIERMKFLFFSLWSIRKSFSSYKLSLIEFLNCIYPSWYEKYKNSKKRIGL